MIDGIFPPDIMTVFWRYPSLASELNIKSPWTVSQVQKGAERLILRNLFRDVKNKNPQNKKTYII